VSTPLEDYALLGDRRTAALVARNGSVDWWCVPRFDGGACFAALLGSRDHGRFLLAPVGDGEITRQYRPQSLVLETEFATPTGTVRITDCLATATPHPCLVRLVEGLSGTTTMQFELVMRFDYGSVVPWVRRRQDGLTAIAGPDGLRLRTPIAISGHDLRTTASFEVRAGEQVPFVLEWFPSHLPPETTGSAEALVSETDDTWRGWSAQCNSLGKYHEVVLRSLLTLDCLTYAPTGGLVAAPTTSLPESVGGTRNWDYRFCWVRDATLTLQALVLGGYRDEARRFREWVLRAVAGDPEKLQIMYGIGGERRLTELTLDWLPGWNQSSPVRVGNAAHEQLQLDVYGELADIVWQGARAGFPVDADVWALQLVLTDSLEKKWREPDEGIWEVRGPRRHFVHSKVLSWVAFDRAIAIVEHARDAGIDGPVDRWRAARDEIHEQVCARGYNAKIGAFVQSYDSDRLDASVLMIPLVGFLPGDDPRVRSTIDVIDRELTVDGLVRRYDPQAAEVDGIGEPEGVFLACSFWMVSALAAAGRRKEAQARFDRLLELANDVGLFSEQYDPAGKRLLGNFPQAFTHLALVDAAQDLVPQRALRRRRDRPDDERITSAADDRDPGDVP
jgi:GH15 family glucan-1,4-alpha-glucosidase